MTFAALPADLQDLVLQFAYKIKLVELEKDLKDISLVKSWGLEQCFIRTNVWTKGGVWCPIPWTSTNPCPCFKTVLICLTCVWSNECFGGWIFEEERSAPWGPAGIG